ncbi:phospholipase D domain protein [Ancylostoma caninum]|uniref:Phospholipase D domain protein n=1 Tax=Ancylostoma caninum TaxID=29170 RepID=A0A368GUE3_ANCCA|nr:phospholipase D domain protein [Ancylostoma caninum]
MHLVSGMTVRCENALSKEILKANDQRLKLNNSDHFESNNNYAKVRFSTTVIVVSSLLILSFIILSNDSRFVRTQLPVNCQQSCRVQFVESIPTGLNFSAGPIHRATHEAWLDLLNKANESIHIAALYWNLNSSEYPTAEYGRHVYEQLVEAGRRGVSCRSCQIRIAQDVSKGMSDNEDSRRLAEQGLAEVRTLDFDKLLGSGVLHTKLIIVDMKNIYVGSANMDWKSLAEVKELGLYIQSCPCVAEDLHKIFKVYWHLGKDGARIPPSWPSTLDTPFNILSPMEMVWDGVQTDVFISVGYCRKSSRSPVGKLLNERNSVFCGFM